MSEARILEYWSPPDGAGHAVACLATSFTFNPDFFSQDCLSRFLSLTSTTQRIDGASTIASIIEEEERLSEVQVSVLIDQSSGMEKRNLRWDLLPVVVDGGLLHAKVAILIWENVARIIIGSANLTDAGYRKQVEIVMALDLDRDSQVPLDVVDGVVAELRELVDLAPGQAIGPKARALGVIGILEDRVRTLNLPTQQQSQLRLAFAPARAGVSPLDRLADVWSGNQPLKATVLSPFWDDKDGAPAVRAISSLLIGRPAEERSTTLVTSLLQAPLAWRADDGTVRREFKASDDEIRTLHAKCILFEGVDWIAAMIGSSNATEAGLGLNRRRGHREMNLWIGCPLNSPTAKQLRSLIQQGDQLEIGDTQTEAVMEDEERAATPLPPGFASCLLDAAPPTSLVMELDPPALENVAWSIELEGRGEILSSRSWVEDGSPSSKVVELREDVLPSFLNVRWVDQHGEHSAAWVVNVIDRAALPPPLELADLPIEVLLSALASTRPLPMALERELERHRSIISTAAPFATSPQLDPLKRFDSSRMLLQRVRRDSVALWRLGERLSRPTSSLDALRWRLKGAFGPIGLARSLAKGASEPDVLEGEPQFLIAELALTIKAIDWRSVAPAIDPDILASLINETLEELDSIRATIPSSTSGPLSRYVVRAIERARS